MAAVVRLIPGRTVLLVCDMQTRFRTSDPLFPSSHLTFLATFYRTDYPTAGPLVHGFDHVVATGSKMLKLAKVC